LVGADAGLVSRPCVHINHLGSNPVLDWIWVPISLFNKKPPSSSWVRSHFFRVHVNIGCATPHTATPHWPNERFGPNMHSTIPIYNISSYTIVSTTYLRGAYETKISFKLYRSATGCTGQSWSMSGGCIHSDEVNCGHQRGSLSRTCAEVGGCYQVRGCVSRKKRKKKECEDVWQTQWLREVICKRWGWFDSCHGGWRRSDMIWMIDFWLSLFVRASPRIYNIFFQKHGVLQLPKSTGRNKEDNLQEFSIIHS
jgi:hypothetical protein